MEELSKKLFSLNFSNRLRAVLLVLSVFTVGVMAGLLWWYRSASRPQTQTTSIEQQLEKLIGETSSPAPKTNLGLDFHSSEPAVVWPWKTYDSALFSIYVPKDWTIQEKDENGVGFSNYSPDTALGLMPSVEKGHLKLVINLTSNAQSVSEYVQKQKEDAQTLWGQEIVLKTTPITLDGQPATKLETRPYRTGFKVIAKHPIEATIIDLSFEASFDNYPQLADQILSSFIFLRKKPQIPTSWKWYTNITKSSYSISYPPEYRLGSCRACDDLTTAELITFTPPEPAGYGTVKIEVLRKKEKSESTDQFLEDISRVDMNPVVSGSKERIQLNGFETLTTMTSNYGYETKNIFILIYGTQGLHISFSGIGSPENRGIALKDLKNYSVYELMVSSLGFGGP